MKKAFLNDGAFLGLAEGAQMTETASFNEILDNFFGKQASKVNIVYKPSENYLEFVATEENDLTEDIAVKKLYGLGVGGELVTQDNGVGKYNQGFKYAVAWLIGKGNKGKVRIDSKPCNGEPWATEQTIDYSNPLKYTDQDIYGKEDGIEYEEIDPEYNFRIRIYGCKLINPKDVIELILIAGLRYRDKIEKGQHIYFNGSKIVKQDRLYKSLGEKRVQYESEFIQYKNNPKAAMFEYVDLEDARVEQTELIAYDSANGRKKSVANTSRGGIEVVYNGITVIYENLPTEFKRLCDKDFQPGAASFRGRLTILDRCLYDDFFRGGNKSAVSVAKDFVNNEETINIRRSIASAYRNYCIRHNVKDKDTKARYSPIINGISQDIEVKLQERGEDVSPFIYDEKTKTLTINETAKLFKKYTQAELLAYAMLYTADSFDEALKNLKKIDAEIG